MCYYTNNRNNGGQLGIIPRTFCRLRCSRRRGGGGGGGGGEGGGGGGGGGGNFDVLDI